MTNESVKIERTGIDAFLDQSSSLEDRLQAALHWMDNEGRSDPKSTGYIIEHLLPEVLAKGDERGAAWLRFHESWIYIESDNYKRGLSILSSVKDDFQKAGDSEGQSRSLNALGVINANLGIYDLGFDYYMEALKVLEKNDSQNYTGSVYINMADCLYELGEFDEAFKTIETCASDYYIPPRNVSPFHRARGRILCALGRPEEGEQAFLEAIRFSVGWLLMELAAKESLAELYLDLGRMEEAGQLIESSIREALDSNDRFSQSSLKILRAKKLLKEGHPSDALPDIQSAILLSREIGMPKTEAEAENCAFLIWKACGDHARALDSLVRYHTLIDAMKTQQTTQRIYSLHAERTRTQEMHYENLYKQFASISEIGQRITANLDLDIALESIYEALNGLMNAPTIMIATVDEEEGYLDYRLVIVRGRREATFRFPLSADTFGCWCVRERSDILIGDIHHEYQRYLKSDPDKSLNEFDEQSLVFVPLTIRDKVEGAISVQSDRLHAYDKRSVEIVRAVGGYLAIAIENARLFKQIQQFATNDSLTGLLNRRCFTEAITHSYFQTKHNEASAGMIMIDIDHFKSINDTYGHALGDEVLRGVAGIFRESLRDSDSASRFGGEEFVILLPETRLEETLVIAERLRTRIESLRIPVPQGGSIAITASFGASVIHPQDTDLEVIMKRADKALYKSKQAGRNCVSVEVV